jgi:hypothetical protein
MCATMLRARPPASWDATLAHVVFEPDSDSTRQNVSRTTPILTRFGAQRVLVVSAPVYRGGGRVENHALRAMQGFRAMRPPDADYRIAGLACSFLPSGPHWSGGLFTPTDGKRVAAAGAPARDGH